MASVLSTKFTFVGLVMTTVRPSGTAPIGCITNIETNCAPINGTAIPAQYFMVRPESTVRLERNLKSTTRGRKGHKRQNPKTAL
jgi:hypothetical protein